MIFARLLAVVGLFVAPAAAGILPTQECDPVTGCPPRITWMTYAGQGAYRLHDGARAEAVVLANSGRLVHLSRMERPNWLWEQVARFTSWKAKPQGEAPDPGGQMTWLAPQSDWPRLSGAAWPPDPAWSGPTEQVQVLPGAIIRVTMPRSRSGVRIIKEMSFSATDTFSIRQIGIKEAGQPLEAALWSVTRLVPTRLLLPRQDGVEPASLRSESLPKLTPWENFWRLDPTAGPWKLGLPSREPHVVAVRGKETLRQEAALSPGLYPDGGYPVEVFASGPQKSPFLEIEHLSPVRRFIYGSRWQFTVQLKLGNA